jgi:hypothetical protein
MFNKLLTALALTVCASPLLAQTLSDPAKAPKTDSILYLGAGNSTGGYDGDKTPLSGGYLVLTDRLTFGADIGHEGKMLDARGSNYAWTQGMSYNLLIGRNLHKTDRTRLDATLLLGVRETSQECPSSVLGFDCFADMEPERTFDLNYGGLVTYTLNKTSIGLRVTGESVQGVLGWKF